MADAQNSAAPKKARKAQGPRKVKPFYVVATITNEDGSTVLVDKSRLSVKLVQNPAELVPMLTGANAAPVSFVQEVAAPVAPKAAPAA